LQLAQLAAYCGSKSTIESLPLLLDSQKGERNMTDSNTDKPWEHPEQSDWCKGLNFMANQIRAGKPRSQVVEDTSKYVDDNELKFAKSNIDTYYPWLYREVKKEHQE